MTDNTPNHGDERVVAEFDAMADDYYAQHKANIAITGEEPEYFSEYKIADLSRFVRESDAPAARIFDFGSGIGNSLPYFRKHLGQAALSCGDVSARSIDIARKRFPGNEDFILIDDAIPLASGSQDIVFSACVFHHIPHELHDHWLRELLRLTRPGGLLAIYEHNPLNPLTVRAVNTCPLDVNARLIHASTLRRRAAAAGWSGARIDYRLFFPAFMKVLRPTEPFLSWLPLGAQYRMAAWRPR
jgi:SAM-dependent methyltransferase